MLSIAILSVTKASPYNRYPLPSPYFKFPLILEIPTGRIYPVTWKGEGGREGEGKGRGFIYLIP